MARKRKIAGNSEVELRFKSEEEEVEFWETISDEDLLAITEEVSDEELHVDARVKEEIRKRAQSKQLISLRIERRQLRLAKEIARRKSIPYQVLIRRWIDEGIKRELYQESDYIVMSSPSLVVQYEAKPWSVEPEMQTVFSFMQQSPFSSAQDYVLYTPSTHEQRRASRKGNFYD